MDLSIVIVSYRTPEHLKRCLTRLSQHKARCSFEVLVVDNESGDESPEIARSFESVTVIESGANLGFAGGVNRGLAAGRGRYSLVLNPDVEVGPNSLDELVDYMDDHPEVGLAGPKLLNTDGSLQHSCRRFYTFKAILLRRTFLGKLFPNSQTIKRHLMLDYDHEEPRAVDWVAGAAMVVRREAIEDVGPMDERYFLYFEDVDWCTRMQARGWTVHYVPQSTMTHHWQRASSQFSSSARTHLRSGLRFYERWGSFLYVLRQYRQTWTKMGLFLFDILAITGSFLLAFLMRRQLAGLLEKPVWPLSYYGGFIVFSLLVFLGSFAANRLYREVRSGDWVDVFFRVFRAATIGSLLVMAGTFILDMQGFSRVLVLAVWPLSAVLAFLGRRILYASFLKARRERLNLRRVALLGTGETLDGLEQLMRQDLDLGWEPVRMRRAEITDERPADFLLKRLSSERVSDVVLTPEFFPEGSGDFGERMLPLRRAGIRVRVLSSFLASMPPRARLEPVGDMSWLSFERPNLKPAGFSKRSFDLIAATLLTVVGLVPVLLLALGRLLRRRPFLEPKGEFVGRWGETFTSRGIAGGGLLQGYPRLGSVFRGTCSLVGPRPLRPGEPTPGGEAWERVREHHRPGWLGPWTLTPVLTPNEEMQQELRYLEQWSPEGDLKLLVRVALNHSNGGSGRGTPTPATHTSDPKGAESAGITTGGSRLVGHEWS